MGDDEKATVSQEALGTGLAALIGLAMGGPPGAVIGAAAAPHLTELVRRAWDEVVAFREGQLENVIDQGADLAGVTPDELVETMQGDPEQRRLLHGTLIAAADARDQDKIRGLARCLANGFEDPARVDEEALIVRALVDLDPVHVRVLSELERRSMTAKDIHVLLTDGFDAREFVTATDLSGPVLTVLERNGLASSEDEIRTPRGGAYQEVAVRTNFSCTSFGRECLKRLGRRNRFQTPSDLFAD